MELVVMQRIYPYTQRKLYLPALALTQRHAITHTDTTTNGRCMTVMVLITVIATPSYIIISQAYMRSSKESLIFFGIVSVAFALFLLIARLNAEVYTKTNSPIVRRQIYFDGADFYNIKSAIEEGKFETLDKFKRVDEGNVQLYVVHSRDKKFAALQLLKYEPFDFIPQTEVKVREF